MHPGENFPAMVPGRILVGFTYAALGLALSRVRESNVGSHTPIDWTIPSTRDLMQICGCSNRYSVAHPGLTRSTGTDRSQVHYLCHSYTLPLFVMGTIISSLLSLQTRLTA